MCVKTKIYNTLYPHMCTSTSEQMCVPMLFSEHGVFLHTRTCSRSLTMLVQHSPYTLGLQQLSWVDLAKVTVKSPSRQLGVRLQIQRWTKMRIPGAFVSACVTPRATCISPRFRTSSKTSTCRMAASSPPIPREIQRSANRKTYWNSGCIFWYTLSNPGQVDYSWQSALPLPHNFICLHIAHPRMAVSKLLHIKTSTATCNTLQFSLFKIGHGMSSQSLMAVDATSWGSISWNPKLGPSRHVNISE